MAQYGKPSYWDDRYTKDPEPFDWYQRYSGIKDLINQYIPKNANILMSGAGNSRLSEDMVDDGYSSIVNVDISKIAVDAMAEKYKDRDEMKWQVMDVCELDFPDETFDAVVDKGTMDSLLCGDNSVANVAKMCQEMSRVMKPGGVYFIVSYGVPENRLNHLENEDYGWTVHTHTIPKPAVNPQNVPDTNDPSSVHYVYVCKYGGGEASAAQ